MVAGQTAPPRGHSVQISSISTTVGGTQKAKDLSVKVDLGGVRIEKRQFKNALSSEIRFSPPCSIDGDSTLSVQLCKSSFIRDTVVLTRMNFTVQMAQKILGDLTEVNDHLVGSDAQAEFRLSFSMKPNATEDLILAGVEVADNFKSILERLGTGYKFIETFLSIGSELHPIAKAVLVSVEQVKKNPSFSKCRINARRKYVI
ncbi:hypothetical protein C8R44DRAFT_69182 [Mycena epipterygia]|nr:hypothetical protein C8R44DRAFT_69182 [Mycena epipterygia]